MKQKILFIIPSMRGGGSERVISILLNHLNRRKFDMTLVLIKKEGRYLQDLPNDIKIIDVNLNSAKKSIFKLIKIIKNENPNIVFSTLGYLNLIISIIRPFLSKKIKFIARESSIVSIQNKQEKYPKLFDFLFKTFYKNFDLVIAQSKYMKNDLIKNYNFPKEKIKVIYNPVDIEKIEKLSKEPCNKNVELVAVGRLDKNKNFKDIIEILPKLNMKLTILGEGKEKENLQNLAKKLNVNVEFLGFVDNPYKYMKKAKLLVLTSLYEGLPNVILEANACGIPVIAYNCIGGTQELIENGKNGFLVECKNKEELKNRILWVLNNNINNKIVDFIAKYKVSAIINKYEGIFVL